jgi:outer membrane protein assembly factor BamD
VSAWRSRLVLFAAVGMLTACGPAFLPRNFANPDQLFRASMAQFERGKFNNAVVGFERLTIDLSARDSLLPRSYFYLAQAHEELDQYLLAAQAYGRIAETFPGDTLAPRALLGQGRSFQKLWRKPALDPEYGRQAMGVFRALISAYPDAPEVAEAAERITQVEDWLAQKDYETGRHYYRTRKALDSALLYLQDVVERYPDTPAARLAWLLMHRIYDERGWNAEEEATCVTLRERYPDDAEVREACPAPEAAAVSPDGAAAG